MTRLQEELCMACELLGIDIEIGCVLFLKDGQKINTVALIPSLGGPNGMVIVKSTDDILPIWNDFNYGFSVLDEPSENAAFDLDSFREMFVDWGWTAKNEV